MTKRLHSDDRIQAIYDAISEQTGDTTPMTTAGMAAAILEISGSDLMELLASASETISGTDIIQLTDDTVKTESTVIPTYIGHTKAISKVSFAEVLEVKKYAFYNAIKLTNVDLPKCTTIGDYAFYNIPYQEAMDVTLNLPKVKTIGNNAFDASKVAGTLSLPECETINANGFANCSKVRGINLPKVKTIGTYAFSLCSITADVDLPLVETIAESAFSRGVNCTNFIIGSNCTSIGSKVFYDSDVVNLYVHAATPPTFGGNFGYDAHVDHIYVPADSVAAYKAASGWSSFASIIEAIPAA